MRASLDFYFDKEKKIAADLAKFERQSGILSFFRLITFISSAALCIWGVVSHIALLYAVAALIFVLFIVLCVVHGGILDRVSYLTELKKVNSSYIARINGDLDALSDLAVKDLKRSEDINLAKAMLYGDEFYDAAHDYCADLDVFGKKSLFSLFNVSETAFGRRRFAELLMKTHTSSIKIDELRSRQKAVEALCSKPDVLLDYQATAKCGKMTKDPKILLDFASNGSKTKTAGNVLAVLGCVVWLAVPAAFVLFPAKAVASIPFCLIFNLVIWIAGRRFNELYIRACDGMPNQVKTILKLYSILERSDINDELIKALVKGNSETGAAYESLKKLDSVLRLAALRSQPLFAFLLNIVFPLDYLVAYLLGNWSVKFGKSLPSYIDNLAEIEALMCTAQTGLVLPESACPVFVESDEPSENAYFEGETLYHPLLKHDSVVSNSVTIDRDIAIITGSNMSGKTTMIRTVGVCTILALTGGFVPATALKLGRMRVMSSMRIVDSLEENMSTFKAELIRISGIVKASGEEKAMMFLIDEIFRGTNSDDRTEGALTVLKRLSKSYVCGLMTTHDYAMIDKTEKDFDNIRYYHFSEAYTESEITFDYKLASGISRQSNASYLMRLVGIK